MWSIGLSSVSIGEHFLSFFLNGRDFTFLMA